MRAEVVAMTGENLDMDAIKKAGDILKAGGLVAFPTETAVSYTHLTLPTILRV